MQEKPAYAVAMSALPLYNALIRAGVPEEEAQAAAESVAGTDQVAVKADLAELRAELARMEMRITLRLAGWVLLVGGIVAAIVLAGVRLMLGMMLGG